MIAAGSPLSRYWFARRNQFQHRFGFDAVACSG